MVVAALAAGLVEMEVHMSLGVALACLACVGTRLPGVIGEVKAPVVKRFSHPMCIASPIERQIRFAKVFLLPTPLKPPRRR